jgi:hypothetical protein
MGNNAVSGIEKARFYYKFLLLKNCAKYCLDLEPVQKLFQSLNRTWNRNRNKIGSTTLEGRIYCWGWGVGR